MKAEIIAIGTEILLGQILNSNHQYLSQRLAELGIDVYHQSTVGDNPGRLAQAIRQGMARSDIVITTGGLGPTVDDVTLEAVAYALGRKLILDKMTLARIKSHFGKQCIGMPAENIRQAHVPEGAIVLKNYVGTAPGLIIEEGKNILIALPGPPRELSPIFERDVTAYLKRKVKSGWTIRTRTINIAGLSESQVNHKVRDILASPVPVTVGIFAHPGLIELKITAKAEGEKKATALINKMDKEISGRLGGYVFGRDAQTLEEIVGKALLRRRKTIAVAESCSGGLISSRITDVPGSSRYFKMGVVAYSNDLKISRLNVAADALERYGAVSAQVAGQMAKNVMELAGATFGLGVTGIAGPTGATRKKPVGLVYVALAAPKRLICREFHFTGEREVIKFKASQAALDLVRRNI